MKSGDEIRQAIGAEFPEGFGDFRPCAFFDAEMDCIRVVARDCSALETRVNTWFTILEANYPAKRANECVGFTLKGARHFCETQKLDPRTPIQMSVLLDAIVRAMPDAVIQTVVEHLARPMVEEHKIEQVLPQAA